MDDNTEMHFLDMNVTFGQFVDSLATKVALRIHQVEKGQLEISQAQAYRMFGRADVDRWVKNGKLKPVRISACREQTYYHYSGDYKRQNPLGRSIQFS